MGLLDRIKQTGWRYSFEIAFNRFVPKWLFRCRKFNVYQLGSRVERSTHTPLQETVVGWCDSDADTEAVEKLTYFNRSLSSGDLKACQARIGNDLAGGFWRATKQFDESELGIRYRLNENQAWLFAALVDTAHRRKGIYNEILRFILPALDEKGLTHQLVAVNPPWQ